jgi:hypothetical protein
MAEARENSGMIRSMALHKDALAAPKGSAVPESGADYYALVAAITEAADEFIQPRGRVIDLAIENGDLGSHLLKKHWDLCAHVGICSSQKAAMEALDKHRLEVHLGMLDIRELDLEERFPQVHADMIIAPGCLAELDRHRLREVLSMCRHQIGSAGALVVIEWSPAAEAALDEAWETVLEENGFSQVEQIWNADGRSAWVAHR